VGRRLAAQDARQVTAGCVQNFWSKGLSDWSVAEIVSKGTAQVMNLGKTAPFAMRSSDFVIALTVVVLGVDEPIPIGYTFGQTGL
jgi:hypothetical protein